MNTTDFEMRDFVVTVEKKIVTRVRVPATSEDHAIRKVERYGVGQYPAYDGYAVPGNTSVKARRAPPETMKQLRAKFGRKSV